MTMVYRIAVPAVLVLALGSFARAQTFAPINCSGNTLPFVFSSDELEDGKTGSLNYANNIKYKRWFLANGHVRTADFRFASFHTETFYDYFYISQNGMSWWAHTGDKSSLVPFSSYVVSTPGLQGAPVQFEFNSDSSIEKPGFLIDQVTVSCNSTFDSTVATAANHDRYDGVLLGTNDTIFIRIPASTTGVSQRVHLWGRPGRDFDLYARCNANPTSTTFYTRGYTSSTEESIELPPSSCAGGHWHIAVNSFAGSGDFRLFFFGGSGYSYGEFDVGTWYTMDTATKNAARQTVLDSLKSIYGATHGEKYIPTARFWNDGDCDCGWFNDCEMCLSSVTGVSNYTDGHITLYKKTSGAQYWWETVRHEVGHSKMGLPDEYDTSPAKLPLCHHTYMSRYGGVESLCYDSNLSDHVNPENHPKDPAWEAVGTAGPYSGYYLIGSQPYSRTPENALWPGTGNYGDRIDPFDSNGFSFAVPNIQVIDQ